MVPTAVEDESISTASDCDIAKKTKGTGASSCCSTKTVLDSGSSMEDEGEGVAVGEESVESSAVVGSVETLLQQQGEVRCEPRHYVYPPTAHWWEPPFVAWVPSYNREILAGFGVYNTAVVLLARYTSLCGNHTANDVELHTFCSDDFILLHDKALTGLAVGLFLLLAFRANQAYSRFWEGRQMWGRMKEVSRDFCRLVCTHVQVETEDQMLDRRRAVAYVAVFAAATKSHLRHEQDILRDVQAFTPGCRQRDLILPLQDIANLAAASHRPLFCQDQLSRYLQQQYRAGCLSDYQMGVLHTTCLAVMSDTMGSCERLNNTPIPLSYALQLRFFLILWLVYYPLHVVAYYGWWTLLLANLVAYAVLGIESMACEIENPFGYDRNDLPLDDMVMGFFKDTQEILKRAESLHREFIFDRQAVNELSSHRFDGKMTLTTPTPTTTQPEEPARNEAEPPQSPPDNQQAPPIGDDGV